MPSSKEQFAPLCDLHHTPMQRMMLEEDSDSVRSFHACVRRDCTRVFRVASGYTDRVEGSFDAARPDQRVCPNCGAMLYLAEVDHTQKIETWECPQLQCGFSDDSASPSAR